MQVEMSEHAAQVLEKCISDKVSLSRCSGCANIITVVEIADTNGGDAIICQACFDDPPAPNFDNHDCNHLPGREPRVGGLVVDRARRIAQTMCQACGQRFNLGPDQGRYFFQLWAAGWVCGRNDASESVQGLPEPYTDRWVTKYES